MIKVKMNHNTRSVLLENHGERFIENGIKRALGDIGKLIKKETVKGIKSPPKTGHNYISLRNRSSAAGEYPAHQTGKLERSINYKVVGVNKMVVGAKAEYAKYLEDGTSRMKARKLLGSTIASNANEIRNIIRQNIDKVFK